MHQLSTEQKAYRDGRIKRMRKQGLTYDVIGKRLGLSKEHVRKVLRMADLSSPGSANP